MRIMHRLLLIVTASASGLVACDKVASLGETSSNEQGGEDPAAAPSVTDDDKEAMQLYGDGRFALNESSNLLRSLVALLEAQSGAQSALSMPPVASVDWGGLMATVKKSLDRLAKDDVSKKTMIDAQLKSLLEQLHAAKASEGRLVAGTGTSDDIAVFSTTITLLDSIYDLLNDAVGVLIARGGDIIAQVLDDTKPVIPPFLPIGSAQCQWQQEAGVIELPAVGGPMHDNVLALAGAAKAKVITGTGPNDCASFEKLRQCLHQTVVCPAPQQKIELNCNDPAERVPGSFLDRWCEQWAAISPCPGGYVGCSGDRDVLTSDAPAPVPPKAPVVKAPPAQDQPPGGAPGPSTPGPVAPPPGPTTTPGPSSPTPSPNAPGGGPGDASL